MPFLICHYRDVTAPVFVSIQIMMTAGFRKIDATPQQIS
jgi:hypothetical protein